MWEINISNQAQTFLFSMLFGVLMCLLYDVIRALNKNGGGSVIIFFRDILFWIHGAILTFLFLLSRTNGEIRGYVLIASLIGFFICRVTLSKIFFPILALFFRAFKRGFFFIENIIEKFSDIIIRFFEYLFVKNILFLKLIIKTLKKLLKSIRYLLYTIFVNKFNRKALDGCETET